MDDRRTVWVRTFDAEEHDGDRPPQDAHGFIAWFQAKIAEIPEEFRHNASIEIDSNSGYEGSHSAHIEISFTRPETDEELATHIKEAARLASVIEAGERAVLAALQAKYDPSPTPRPEEGW